MSYYLKADPVFSFFQNEPPIMFQWNKSLQRILINKNKQISWENLEINEMRFKHFQPSGPALSESMLEV